MFTIEFQPLPLSGNASLTLNHATNLESSTLQEDAGLSSVDISKTQLLDPNQFFTQSTFSSKKNNVITGSNQDDHLKGEKNESESFLGKSGSDVIRAGKNDDSLKGGKEQDWLRGQKGHDVAFGNVGDDRIWGDAGRDRLRGDQGNDVVLAGQGNDAVQGGTGNDVLSGGLGNDWLYGNQGNDVLRGDKGRDRLIGHRGKDVLDGGHGVDVLFGGKGNDMFVLSQYEGNAALENVDVILDFTPGEDTLVFVKRIKGDRLDIMAGKGDLDGDTVIRDANTGNYLAILKDVCAEDIQPESFGMLDTSLRIRKNDMAIPSATQPSNFDETPDSPGPVVRDPITPEDPLPTTPVLPEPTQPDPSSSSPGSTESLDPDPSLSSTPPTDSPPTDPPPTDPPPTDPPPTDPPPTDPPPTDPPPTDPPPTDPPPTDPPPTDPPPTDPPPIDPPPTDPPPTDPPPTNPPPTNPPPSYPTTPLGDVVTLTSKFSGSDTEATIAATGAASITIGTQTFYIGTQQVSSNNQNPIISSFDSSTPSLTWDRTDYEVTGADGRGYGLFWSGTNLYGIFSVDGTQGSSSEDFRRASGDAVQNWLKSYGSGGGPKVAVIGRIDPQTGALLDAAYLSAVLSNGNSNSLQVTGITMNGANLLIQAKSWFAPRNPNGSRMTQTGTGGSPFDYTVEITPDLSQVVNTSAVGWE